MKNEDKLDLILILFAPVGTCLGVLILALVAHFG